MNYECLMPQVSRSGEPGAAGWPTMARRSRRTANQFRLMGVVREFLRAWPRPALFHDAPEVRPLLPRPGRGPELKPGMFFPPSNPMINAGKPWAKVLGDALDGGLTRDKVAERAVEHSIAITETGNEIFTEKPDRAGLPALRVMRLRLMTSAPGLGPGAPASFFPPLWSGKNRAGGFSIKWPTRYRGTIYVGIGPLIWCFFA